MLEENGEWNNDAIAVDAKLGLITGGGEKWRRIQNIFNENEELRSFVIDVHREMYNSWKNVSDEYFKEFNKKSKLSA